MLPVSGTIRHPPSEFLQASSLGGEGGPPQGVADGDGRLHKIVQEQTHAGHGEGGFGFSFRFHLGLVNSEWAHLSGIRWRLH